MKFNVSHFSGVNKCLLVSLISFNSLYWLCMCMCMLTENRVKNREWYFLG